jgi:hypothetical protein
LRRAPKQLALSWQTAVLANSCPRRIVRRTQVHRSAEEDPQFADFLAWLADWLVVGLFGVVQALWFPPVLRIAHSLVIGADSFADAAAIVFLLCPRSRETRVQHVAGVAHQLPS